MSVILQISHFNFDSLVYSDQICFTPDSLVHHEPSIIYNLPKQRLVESANYNGQNTPGFCPQDFQFYYMIHVEKSFLYDNQTKIYGYLGISPQSFTDQYGIFKQIPNLDPIVGLQATKSNGQLIIGAYDRSVVQNYDLVQWFNNPNLNRT